MLARANTLRQARRLFLVEAVMTDEAVSTLTDQRRLSEQMQRMAPSQRDAAQVAAWRQGTQAASGFVVTENGEHVETSLIGGQLPSGERVSLIASAFQATLPNTVLQLVLFGFAVFVMLPMFFLIFPLLIAAGMIYWGLLIRKTNRLIKAIISECETFILTA